MAEKVILNYN